MSPDSNSIDSEPPDEPLAVLRNLELEPTSNLPVRVRRGIERRFLGRDLAGFYWTAIASVVMEWLSASLGRFGSRSSEKGPR